MLWHEHPHVFSGLRCEESFEEEFQVGLGARSRWPWRFSLGRTAGAGVSSLGDPGQEPTGLPAQGHVAENAIRPKDARYDQRLHAILLVAQGQSCREVGKILGDTPWTVAYVLSQQV